MFTTPDTLPAAPTADPAINNQPAGAVCIGDLFGTTPSAESMLGRVYDVSDPTCRTGTSKLSPITEFQAMLCWPGLYMLADTIDAMVAEHRRKKRNTKAQARAKSGETTDRNVTSGGLRAAEHSTAVLLAVLFGARTTGSRASILTLLANPRVWEELIKPVYDSREENAGIPFPGEAPTREQLRRLERSIFEVEGWRKRLQHEFQCIAVGQAKELGNLVEDETVDWSRPSLRNTIAGDGVVMKPLSGVTEELDLVTGEIFHTKSRAKVQPRLAPRGTDKSEDGKDHLAGITMVAALTPTDFGWVVLGTGAADGAEVWAALDLIDGILPKARGGAHVLLWDRVFTGSPNDYLLAKYGTRVFNKSVADSRAVAKKLDEDTSPSVIQRGMADVGWASLLGTGRHDVLLAEHAGLYTQAAEDDLTAKGMTGKDAVRRRERLRITIGPPGGKNQGDPAVVGRGYPLKPRR